MTERQAWVSLAKRAELAATGEGPDGRSFFLCNAIHRYDEYRGLEEKLLTSIRRAQRAHSSWAWLWDTTYEGHLKRAAFCRRQVARIDRAKARAKATKAGGKTRNSYAGTWDERQVTGEGARAKGRKR